MYPRKGVLMIEVREKLLLDVFEIKLPQYYSSNEIRTSQVQMAVDVAEFLHQGQKNKKILFIEVPVGTGKSLGALVPALIECSIDRAFTTKRIVYATATINLQGQLMNSEVPLLKELQLLDTALLAKGKSHYYCQQEMKKESDIETTIITNLTDFYKTAYTGQRDEYETNYGEISNSIWDRVSLKATKKECDRCIFSQGCPSINHRNRFLISENDLVITNHEQLIRSVLNKLQEVPFPPIVPVHPGFIIIDEAHHFIENFLSQLQENITIRDLRAATKSSRFPQKIKKQYLQKIDRLEKKLQIDADNCESMQGRYPLPEYVPALLEEIVEDLSDAIEQLVFQNQESTSNNRFGREDDFSDKLELMVITIKNLLDKRRHVSWIAYEELSMECIPVNFPTRFKEVIDYLSRYNKVVVMSGTLTTNGDFSSILNQWRVSKHHIELKIIPQSFQYDKQSLIYVPKNVLNPREQDDNWIADQLKYYSDLINLTEGRTLLLSTSKQHMQKVAEPLKAICDSLDVTLYRQEQGGVEQLTKQFKSDETSVLLGSGSFFSGFSVTGKSLVSVIFTRLPFPVPDDPYLKLIGAGLEDVLMDEVIFPHMMIKLNQGVGRLIRDIGDYGVITILDPRVFDTGYGEKIRRDFEKKGYKITRSFSDVEKFYQEKIEHGSQAEYIPYSRSLITIPASLQDLSPTSKKLIITKKEIKPRRHKITEEQRLFALKICKDRGVNLSERPKFGDDLYMYLFDLYFVTFSSTAPVKDHFPFKNEDQRISVEDYYGRGSQTYTSKKCTHEAFGCSGSCSENYKSEIAQAVSQSGGRVDTIMPGKDFCWLLIKPFNKNDEIMAMCTAIKEAASG
jgi:ATP-dependent DNA helicase DinG